MFLGHGSAAAPVSPTHGLCGEVEAEVQGVFQWYTHLGEEFASESFLMWETTVAVFCSSGTNIFQVALFCI